jgi:transcriptional regulator with XRE-family HTH domain
MKEGDSFSEDLRVGLVFLRALRGWSQAEMAQAAGMDRSQISHYEAGDRVPRGKSLERILKAARVTDASFRAVLAVIRLVKAEEAPPPLGNGEPAAATATVRAVTQALETARAQLLMSRTAGKTGRSTP